MKDQHVDAIIHFDYPTKKMEEELMSKFFKKDISLFDFKPGRSMSFYQTCCLRHMNDPERAVVEACDEMSNINYGPKNMAQISTHKMAAA